jgi:hypothetical protein
MSKKITNVYKNDKPDHPFFIFEFSDGVFVASAEYPNEGEYQTWGAEGTLIDVLNDEPLSESEYPSIAELSEEEAEEMNPEVFELDESEYPSLSNYKVYWDSDDEIEDTQARIEAIKNL